MALKPEIPFITKENINSERDLIEIFDASDETIKLTTISSIGGGGGLNFKDGANVTSVPQIVADAENSNTALRLSSVDVTNYGVVGNDTNAAFGRRALITTGTYNLQNTAIGAFAAENTDQDANVAIGYKACQNYTGYYSVGIGAESLMSTSTYGHIAIGYSALRDMTSGYESVAIGHQTMDSSTYANSSVAIGGYAIRFGSSNANVAVGHSAMYANSNTVGNVAVGENAFRQASTGNDNVMVGGSAGYWISSGSKNTFIGRESGPSSGSGSNPTITGSIAIGYRAYPTASNQFVVGSASTPAGTVTNAAATQTHYWTIKINGTDYKVLLGS